ncbi:MAG: diacylglycerol kinase [Pseudomonadota bacterium]
MMTSVVAEIRRWQCTFGWSVEGWADAWRNDKSLRQWVAVNAASLTALAVVDMPATGRALVFGFGLLVIVAELINSAIERAVDHTSTARHPLAKAAKDIASAAVTMTAFAFGGVWVIMLIG